MPSPRRLVRVGRCLVTRTSLNHHALYATTLLIRVERCLVALRVKSSSMVASTDVATRTRLPITPPPAEQGLRRRS
jgi:hypothetical protein